MYWANIVKKQNINEWDNRFQVQGIITYFVREYTRKLFTEYK